MTPSPSRERKSGAVADDKNPASVFISMALDMSWRLALVVLIPLIGGAELDSHLKTHQWYLIGGGLLAALLAFLVIYQSYIEANKLTAEQLKLLKTKDKSRAK